MSEKKEKIVLVVGDSMAMPRPGVAYIETWPYLMEKSVKDPIHVINRSRRGITTDYLTSEGGGNQGDERCPPGSDCLEFYAPDIAVIQLGIVDCAPRLFSRSGIEKRFLTRMPHQLRVGYLSLVKKYRKRSAGRAYVPLEKFRGNIERYTERCACAGTQVIFIEIAPFGEKYFHKNPEASEARDLYNEILRKQAAKYSRYCHVTPPFDSAEVELCVEDDGYHVNVAGHRRLAQRLVELIESL